MGKYLFGPPTPLGVVYSILRIGSFALQLACAVSAIAWASSFTSATRSHQVPRVFAVTAFISHGTGQLTNVLVRQLDPIGEHLVARTIELTVLCAILVLFTFSTAEGLALVAVRRETAPVR